MNKERFRIPEEAVIEILLSRLDQRPFTRRVRAERIWFPQGLDIEGQPCGTGLQKIPRDVVGLIAHRQDAVAAVLSADKSADEFLPNFRLMLAGSRGSILDRLPDARPVLPHDPRR